MESCGRYIVLVMTFEVATHFLKCISCSITPQTPKPRWTWRYTRASYDSLGVNIIEIIRVKKDKKLKEIITQLWRSPGFSGIREQVKILQKLIITEWKRSRRENEVMPTIPAHLGYVRKLPDKGVKLRAIKIAKAKADKGRNL